MKKIKKALILCSIVVACCVFTSAQENLTDVCDAGDNVFNNSSDQRVKTFTAKYRGESIVVKNDRLITGVEEVSVIGCIGFKKDVKISVRSRLKYLDKTYPLNTYEAGFLTLKFRDKKDGAIIKTVAITSGDEIEWIPATYAEIWFKFPAGLSYGNDQNLLRPNRLQGSSIITYVYSGIPSED